MSDPLQNIFREFHLAHDAVTRSTSRNVDGPPKAPVDSKRVSGGRNNKP